MNGVSAAFLNHYGQKLRTAYHLKKGKLLVLPFILFDIRSRIDAGQKKITVIDLGCGTGELFSLISQSLSPEEKQKTEIIFIGVDREPALLSSAQNMVHGCEVSYVKADLFTVPRSFKRQADILISINTFHELFSQSFEIESQKGKSTTRAWISAKRTVFQLFDATCETYLKQEGSIIFYDGIDVSAEEALEPVIFQLGSISFEDFSSFINQYSLWKLNYHKVDEKTFKMNMKDFLTFISTFKYFREPEWEIESQQAYAYFDLEDFFTVIRKTALQLDSYLLLNNDYGNWVKYASLINEKIQLPFKSILFVAKKEKT